MITPSNYDEILRCPSCKSKISKFDKGYKCSNNECGLSYPIVNSVPILIN